MGSGEKISIWNDCWIPSSPNRKIMTRRGNILLTTVDELIDFESGDWDEQIIRENFWQIDAERILKIPLAIGMMTDFVSWHFNKTGTFSVKSSYHQE